MNAPPKTIAQLKAEYDQDRHLYNRPFVRNETGEDYQLLFPTWDAETQEKQAVIVLSCMSWNKITMPFEQFKREFTEGRSSEMGEAA